MIKGRNALVTRRTPNKLMSNKKLHCFVVNQSNSPRIQTPALLISDHKPVKIKFNFQLIKVQISLR